MLAASPRVQEIFTMTRLDSDNFLLLSSFEKFISIPGRAVLVLLW